MICCLRHPFDGIRLDFLAGSALARCESCMGGLGVGMSLRYGALINARPVQHTLNPKPET